MTIIRRCDICNLDIPVRSTFYHISISRQRDESSGRYERSTYLISIHKEVCEKCTKRSYSDLFMEITKNEK